MNKIELTYQGYKGTREQVRDVLFIEDFCKLILRQIQNFNRYKNNFVIDFIKWRAVSRPIVILPQLHEVFYGQVLLFQG